MQTDQSISFPERRPNEPDATPAQLAELQLLAPDATFPPLGERQAEICIYSLRNVQAAIQVTVSALSDHIHAITEQLPDARAQLDASSLHGFATGYLFNHFFD